MTGENVSILIVDDDEIDVRAIQRELKQQRVESPVYVARDGREGLAMLRGEAGQPPVPRPYMILLDLHMPRMNGLQFLQDIRSDPELNDSIVFVLTTSRRGGRQGRRLRSAHCGLPGEITAGCRFFQSDRNAGNVRDERAISSGP